MTFVVIALRSKLPMDQSSTVSASTTDGLYRQCGVANLTTFASGAIRNGQADGGVVGFRLSSLSKYRLWLGGSFGRPGFGAGQPASASTGSTREPDGLVLGAFVGPWLDASVAR
jgi:hypothetical protein